MTGVRKRERERDFEYYLLLFWTHVESWRECFESKSERERDYRYGITTFTLWRCVKERRSRERYIYIYNIF